MVCCTLPPELKKTALFLWGLATMAEGSGIELWKEQRIQLETDGKAESLMTSVHVSLCAAVSIAGGHSEPSFKSQVFSSSKVYYVSQHFFSRSKKALLILKLLKPNWFSFWTLMQMLGYYFKICNCFFPGLPPLCPNVWQENYDFY